MSKQVQVLLALLMILVIVVLVVENPFKGRAETKVRAGRPLFPADLGQQIGEITVFGKRDTITLAHQEERWLMVDGQDTYPADTSSIRRMLESVPKITDKVVVSRNPAKRDVYEVGTSGAEVVMRDANRDTVAHFVIGKAGPDFSSSYVREYGSNEVLLVGERLGFAFDRVKDSWKDRYLIRRGREEIRSVSVRGPEVSYRLEKNAEGNWQVVEPESGPAKDVEANRLVATVSRFLADRIVAPSDTSATGLEEPTWRIEVTVDDGTVYTVLVGDKTEEEKSYARLEGGRWTYLLGKHRLDPFDKKPEELLAPPEPEPAPVDTAAAGTTPAGEQGG